MRNLQYTFCSSFIDIIFIKAYLFSSILPTHLWRQSVTINSKWNIEEFWVMKSILKTLFFTEIKLWIITLTSPINSFRGGGVFVSTKHFGKNFLKLILLKIYHFIQQANIIFQHWKKKTQYTLKDWVWKSIENCLSHFDFLYLPTLNLYEVYIYIYLFI